jgi:O-antigen/teichoic acid export membrane protein
MRSLLGLRIAFTFAGVVGAVLFAAAAGYGEVIVIGTAFAGLGMLVLNVQGVISVPLNTEMRLGTIAVVDFLRQLVTIVAIVALVWADAGLLLFLAIPTLTASMVNFSITARLVRGKIPLWPSFAGTGIVGLLRDTAAYAAAAAVSTLYFRMTIILLSLTASAKQTGYFSASFRMIEVLTVVPALAVGAAFPILARAARDDRRRFAYAVQRTFEVSLILGTWIALTLALAAPVFIDVVAGPKFEPAVSVLRIQGVAIVGLFCAFAATYGLLSIRRYRDLLWITLLGLAANTGLTLALAPPLGAKGAAIASASTELLLGAAAVWLLRRAPGGVRLSLSGAPRIALAAGLAGATAFTGLPAVVLGLLGTAVFFGALVAFRAIPAEMFDELRRLRTAGPAVLRPR